MAEFPEGSHWRACGGHMFSNKERQSFVLNDGEHDVTVVIPGNRAGFIALSVLSGGVLGRHDSFPAAVAAAEAEALDPKHP